ncbi:MAG: hypothetical protein ACKPGT_27425 [Microcystis sp.]|nr:hypothetical protein [Microcystis aeruginosa]MBE5228046.1 hypothetical protein [Microcystis aeruginosa PMC 728.11]
MKTLEEMIANLQSPRTPYLLSRQGSVCVKAGLNHDSNLSRQTTIRILA